MSNHIHHQYVIELYRQGGDRSERLAAVRVTPDWGPAREWVRFEDLRRHCEAAARWGAEEELSILPCWHDELGPPYVRGFQAALRHTAAPPTACHIPGSYLQPLAQQAVSALVANGTLGEGEKSRYLVLAYETNGPPETASGADPVGTDWQSVPRSERSPRRDAGTADALTLTGRRPLTVEAVPQPLRLHEGALARFLERGSACGPIDPTDVPVFVPQAVINEAIELMKQAGAAETGGILVGHLRRDADRSELFVEVTAQIPARHTQQELTSLTFTRETWADVDAAIALRGLGEMQLGWWHTHPARAWCANCPVENRRVCKLSGEFFSTDDAALHRTVFPRAYSLALVISDSYAHGLTTPLFCWRSGMVQQRGFYVV